MSKVAANVTPETPAHAHAIKRVIFTMGGKGGVGKTSVILALAEWFQTNQIPVTLLDLDTENKASGSLKHYFDDDVHKVNIHTPAGLDAFIDHLGDGARIVLADMGAGSGKVAHEWFDAMYEDVAATGVDFTAVGVVTPDPASVESVLTWASSLQDRVKYVIVENSISHAAEFPYWNYSEQAKRFREVFQPAIIQAEFRLSELENPARQHGVTLGKVAGRNTEIPELQKSSVVMRAQSCRRHLFGAFNSIKGSFLP
jgi:MinD-like ATPase involved in chromosome partitioning or flagellar assembly